MAVALRLLPRKAAFPNPRLGSAFGPPNAGENDRDAETGAKEETDNRMVNSFVELMSFSICDLRMEDMWAVWGLRSMATWVMIYVIKSMSRCCTNDNRLHSP